MEKHQTRDISSICKEQEFNRKRNGATVNSAVADLEVELTQRGASNEDPAFRRPLRIAQNIGGLSKSVPIGLFGRVLVTLNGVIQAHRK